MKTQIIKRFLEANTHQDLAALYNHDMEVQVNVAQDGGQRITDLEYKGRRWAAWTDGIQTWKPFRIPWSDQTYEDSNINYDFESHVEGIGMTGWDWKSKVSKWVGFDFDAIINHKKGLSDGELTDIESAVSNIPWTTLRYSTSGKGRHLYVFLRDLETQNHTEHAALARAILSILSGIVGYDFTTKVDTCGSILWVWHRKMRGTKGLELIKEGVALSDVPINWRDHIPVVTGKRQRNLPNFVAETRNLEAESLFNELTGRRPYVKLDEEHKRLIDWLSENAQGSWWYDSEHHMLVTHTSYLAKAYEELNMRGMFKTIAAGTDTPGDVNLFAFPLKRGSWVIRRYSPGTTEEGSWDTDSSGYTRCYLNKEPSLMDVAKAYGGVEDTDGGFYFREASIAQEAALRLGARIDIPGWAANRKTKLKEHKDGRLYVEFDKMDVDAPLNDWNSKGKSWRRIFNFKISQSPDVEVANYDDTVRHLVTESGEDHGWVLNADNQWTEEPLNHIKSALKSKGIRHNDVEIVLGSSVFKRWVLVKRPFEPEYPGDRTWNRNVPQFKYVPSLDKGELSYPTWMKVLEHCGNGLNNAISHNAWARANGIISGADYLKCWIASVFQNPYEPLPYLFLYSLEQNTGKSIFHEALDLLVTKGIVRADGALTNKSGFNGELENAIICVIEEVNLTQNRAAYNRIKDWVTARKLPVHHLYRSQYDAPNTTHWIQCANEHNACPIFQGDSRITMTYVSPLDPFEIIPKPELMELLRKEASDFLASILTLEIPPSNDRLNIPVIETSVKASVQQSNLTMLERFINEECHLINGSMIQFAEFYDKFREWLDPSCVYEWSKIKVGRELPPQFPHARIPTTGHFYIGNISWEPRNGKPEGPPLIIQKKGKYEYLTSSEPESTDQSS